MKTKLVISVTFAWILIGAVILYLLLKADMTVRGRNVENRTIVEAETDDFSEPWES